MPLIDPTLPEREVKSRKHSGNWRKNIASAPNGRLSSIKRVENNRMAGST